MNTVEEVVSQYHAKGQEALVAALIEREDQIKDQLSAAGMQFGLMPFIVAEVMATIGVGTPPSEDERTLIRANYVNGMRALQEGRDPRTPPEGS